MGYKRTLRQTKVYARLQQSRVEEEEDRGRERKVRRSNRSKRVEKEEDGVMSYELTGARGVEDWAAKQATALPVRDPETGEMRMASVNKSARREAEIDATLQAGEMRREAKQRERQKIKAARRLADEKADEKLFKSEHLNPQQRMDLRKRYPAFVSSVDNLKHGIAEVYHNCMMSPEANINQLELLLTALSVCMRQLSEHKNGNAQDTESREDKAKIILLLLFSIGNILKETLPAYVIQEHTDDPTVKISKEVNKLRHYEAHLLSIYKRWLNDHLFSILANPYFVQTRLGNEDAFSEKIISFCCQFVDVARLTNFADLFMVKMVDLALRVDHCTEILAALQTAVRNDLSLSLAAKLVPAVTDRIVKLKNHKVSKNAQRLLVIFNALDIQKKEASAQSELNRRGLTEGLDLSKSRDRDERELDKELMKSVSAGLIHGNFKTFKANKAKVLTELITLFVRILRSPHLYPVEVVYETLKTLSVHAQFVNTELMVEIFTELRKVCEDNWQKSAASGAIMFGCVMAALELLKAATSANPLDTEISWIGTGVLRAICETLPFVDDTNHAGSSATEATASSGGDGDDAFGMTLLRSGALSGQEFENVVLAALSNRKAFGLNMAELAHLAKSPKATELFVILAGACASTTPGLTRHLKTVLKTMLGHFPSLRGTFDAEGVLMSSLSTPKTVAWTSHLLQQTKVSGASSALPIPGASPHGAF